MRRFYAWIFLLVAALRFLCVPVFVIDDDEAWSFAASIRMKSPWQFYRAAVDHKPPGFVWFYWFVNHCLPLASDPRIVRGAFTVLTIGAALVVGLIARRFAQSGAGETARETAPAIAQETGWCAATLFLLITALPAPKLLAVTADGLIANLVVFAYAAALFADLSLAGLPLGALFSGAILGLALLVKQTSVFFAIPILFARWPRRWQLREIPVFAIGAACVLVPCIFGLGVADFFYWNWTYPKEVLTTVRAELFESNWEGIETLALYLLAILPVAWVIARRSLPSWRSWRSWKSGLGDFRVLWLIAGFSGFAMGKGLFLHYLLLIAPPVACLGAEALVARKPASRPLKTMGWLGIQYVAGCLILIMPSSGIFWGTDLLYFQALGRVVKASLRPGQKAMIWGGSALPLAYARVPYVTRFVLPRFAVPPYATARTRGIFHEELGSEPPDLILDIHERGDNQFDNPIASEPFVANLVRARYKLYVSASIPWAKFYFARPPEPVAGLIEVRDEVRAKELYEPFPSRPRSWDELQDTARSEGLSRALERDWALRAEASLALLLRQGPVRPVAPGSPRVRRERIHDLLARLGQNLDVHSSVPQDLRGEILNTLSSEAAESDGIYPLPILSSAWWATVAMVELQPRSTFNRSPVKQQGSNNFSSANSTFSPFWWSKFPVNSIETRKEIRNPIHNRLQKDEKVELAEGSARRCRTLGKSA